MNGQEAIDSFMLAHELKRPYDVIFMDIMMPEVDGMEALQCIRTLKSKMGIPATLAVNVVMTTDLDDPHTVINSFNKCEADAFIVKPLSKQKLVKDLWALRLVP